MLEKTLRSIGIRKTAKACGVDKGTVIYWCKVGLPKADGHKEKRARYERVIARLTGMQVSEFRKMVRREEAEKSA